MHRHKERVCFSTNIECLFAAHHAIEYNYITLILFLDITCILFSLICIISKCKFACVLISISNLIHWMSNQTFCEFVDWWSSTTFCHLLFLMFLPWGLSAGHLWVFILLDFSEPWRNLISDVVLASFAKTFPYPQEKKKEVLCYLSLDSGT